MWNTLSPSAQQEFEETKRAANARGFEVVSLMFRQAEDIEALYEQATAEGVEALILVPSPLIYSHKEALAGLALRKRLPLISGHREYVTAGALAGYASSLEANFRGAADYVHRILEGAHPRDLPLMQPVAFEMAVNLRTAARLGIEVPLSVQAEASHAVE
jgi:putative ABC transport system substrate-binding protein